MSLKTDLNTLMNADSTINGLVTGIYFQHATDNIALTSEYIVYIMRTVDEISSFDAYNEKDIIDLDVEVYSDSTLTLDTLCEAVRTYLDNYSDSNFLDCRLTTDEQDEDLEKGQYRNILTYRIIYQN